MRLSRYEGVGLLATSHHLPERVVPSSALDFVDDELLRLTGVRARHVAEPDTATSDLVIAASRPLLEVVPPERIDRVLVATVTPDHPSPGTAPLVQLGLGLPQVPSMDLSAACAGYGYGIDLAARCVLTGDRAVLVGAGECRFRTLDRAVPGVRILFGDGAAATVVGRLAPGEGGLLLRATCLGADGRGHGAVRVEAGGSRLPTSEETVRQGLHALRMDNGPMVFFQAVEGLVDVARALLDPLQIKPQDLDLVVPHQPNLRILERVARILRIPLDRFAIEVETVGNVGGASAGIALDRAVKAGRIGPGAKVLLLTAGAGFTAAAALLEGA